MGDVVATECSTVPNGSSYRGGHLKPPLHERDSRWTLFAAFLTPSTRDGADANKIQHAQPNLALSRVGILLLLNWTYCRCSVRQMTVEMDVPIRPDTTLGTTHCGFGRDVRSRNDRPRRATQTEPTNSDTNTTCDSQYHMKCCHIPRTCRLNAT